MRFPDSSICGSCGVAEWGCEGLCRDCEKDHRSVLDRENAANPDNSHTVPRYSLVWDPLNGNFKRALFIKNKETG